MDILWKTIDFGPLQIGVKGQALRQNLRRNAPGDCLTSCWAQKQDRTVKPTNWSERCIQTLSTAVTTGILVVLQFEQVGSWQKTCSLIAGRTLTLGCVVVDAESFFSFPLYTMFFFFPGRLCTHIIIHIIIHNYTYIYIYKHIAVYTPFHIPIVSPFQISLTSESPTGNKSLRKDGRKGPGLELSCSKTPWLYHGEMKNGIYIYI